MTTLSSNSSYVDLRCPLGPKRLLGKVRKEDGHRLMLSNNLLELSCRDCRDIIEKQQGKKPSIVLHRFNVIGELVESEAIW